MPEHLAELDDIHDVESLKDWFVSNKAAYAEQFPEEFKKMIIAKDKRKEEVLLQEEMTDLPDITDLVIQSTTQSNHQSARIN